MNRQNSYSNSFWRFGESHVVGFIMKLSSSCNSNIFQAFFQQKAKCCWTIWLIPHPFPIVEHFHPLFIQIAQMGSQFAQMGSHFAQKTTPNPCSLLVSHHTPLLGICTYTKHPQTHPKTPLFPAWTWKWAKRTTVSVTWTRTGQINWKVDKFFLEVGNFFYLILCFWSCLSHQHWQINRHPHMEGPVCTLMKADLTWRRGAAMQKTVPISLIVFSFCGYSRKQLM